MVPANGIAWSAVTRALELLAIVSEIIRVCAQETKLLVVRVCKLCWCLFGEDSTIGVDTPGPLVGVFERVSVRRGLPSPSSGVWLLESRVIRSLCVSRLCQDGSRLELWNTCEEGRRSSRVQTSPALGLTVDIFKVRAVQDDELGGYGSASGC